MASAYGIDAYGRPATDDRDEEEAQRRSRVSDPNEHFNNNQAQDQPQNGPGQQNQERRYTPEEEDFLRRNPGDEGRMAAALKSGGGSRSSGPAMTTNSGSGNGYPEYSRYALQARQLPTYTPYTYTDQPVQAYQPGRLSQFRAPGTIQQYLTGGAGKYQGSRSEGPISDHPEGGLGEQERLRRMAGTGRGVISPGGSQQFDERGGGEGYYDSYDPLEAQQQQLIERMLSNPETLSPDVVNAMREKEKEDALAFASQDREALERNRISSGMFGGGFHQAQDRRLREGTSQRLIEGNRAIALAKAERDRLDQIGASDAATSFMNSRMNRATQGYNATLGGQMAQEQLNQAGSASGLEVGRFKRETEDRAAAERKAQIASEIQRIMFDFDQEGRGLDEHRFDYGTRVGGAQFGENRRQFDAGMGYQYSALGANQQQALINAILNGGR